jgi:syntaxin 5
VLHTWVVQHRDEAFGSSSGSSSVHAARNSSAIVDSLKQQLMSTTKNFQEVLQVRTNNLKEQNQRRKQFEAGGTGHASHGGGSGGGGGGGGDDAAHHSSSSGTSVVGNAAVRKRGANPFDALMSQAAAASHKAPGVYDDNEASGRDDELSFATPGAGGATMQSQSQEQAAALDQTDEYLSSRAQAVEDIEGTIVQLGQMYQRLVHIVGMQEEITLRIDANMDTALDNMDRGHHELLKYYDSISGSRWLILKVFAVLLAFLVFFMVFVA